MSKPLEKLKENQLGFLEVISLSVAIIGPTQSSSLIFGMIAANVGPAVSLLILLSVIALAFVSVSFIKFGQEFSSAGSAYTYIKAGLGDYIGSFSGWALTFTYASWTGACTSGCGYLLSEFVRHLTGIDIPWYAYTAIALLTVWYITYRDIQVGTRVMLVVEIVSVALLVLIAADVIWQVSETSGLSFEPLRLSTEAQWTGLGAGMVAALMSFGGFEGAASLGAESRNPKKYIPLAIGSTVVLAGLVYVFVSFAEVNGFGVSPEGLAEFVASGSTVVALTERYLGFAASNVITVVIAISAFSTALGALTASTRALYQLSQDGLAASWFSRVHPEYGTPYKADNIIVLLVSLVVGAIVLFSSGTIDGFIVFNYLGTTGSLSLIAVYLLTNVSAIRYFGWKRQVWTWQLSAPIIGTALFSYILWSDVLDETLEFPYTIFPAVTFGLILAGAVYSLIYRKRQAEDELELVKSA